MDDISNSSDDDLGLFSFPNKKTIVCTPPSSPTTEIVSKNDENSNDRGMFMRKNKRKRFTGPSSDLGNGQNNEQDISPSGNDNENAEEVDAIERLNQQYDAHVANICKIDTATESVSPVSLPKKMKKTVEKRDKLLCDLTGVLNKFKTSHGPGLNTPEHPSSSTTHENDNDTPISRSFMLKLRKSSNLHRFKITMDTPLEFVLQHLAPVYSVTPDHFILQLNDETLDPAKTPNQIGLTVADIVEVLVTSAPQRVPVEDVVDHENVIKIKVQSTEHRNNVREYKVFKNKPLVEYLTMACKEFGYEAAKYFFDGEAIDPRRTPLQLDLEEHDCLDIVKQT